MTVSPDFTVKPVCAVHATFSKGTLHGQVTLVEYSKSLHLFKCISQSEKSPNDQIFAQKPPTSAALFGGFPTEQYTSILECI